MKVGIVIVSCALLLVLALASLGNKAGFGKPAQRKPDNVLTVEEYQKFVTIRQAQEAALFDTERNRLAANDLIKSICNDRAIAVEACRIDVGSRSVTKAQAAPQQSQPAPVK